MCSLPHKAVTVTRSKIPAKLQYDSKDGSRVPNGTVVAKERLRTRRVDKGKSGQAQTTAVSGGFGGGILSRIISKRLTLLGERSGACDAVERAIIAELLIVVLTGLGGASQEKSAARNFLKRDSQDFQGLQDAYLVNLDIL